MRTIFYFIPLLFLFSCSKHIVTKIELPSDFIQNDFTQSLQKSKELNRPIFIQFYADWCSHCANFRENILKDPDVQHELFTYFIPSTIDFENGVGPTLAQQFNVSALPSLVICDSLEQRIAINNGQMSKEAFLQWLQAHR